ncbi:hypothetical protein SAMN02746089_01919 [Caldanaerobius fijiensis DSM 17918]|uniref:Uncharacterized protein n=2 Tax=Caldanaerobius TaxID=862261 RepID=A0A1M5BN07_9THEO|nr:hypothetical protein SAMN02746089_01919 [Caldanaerobius fijiensis DSM 17918]
MSNIQAITPQQFGQSLANAIMVLYNSISLVIVPLVMLVLLISAILFIAGAFSHSGTLKKMGTGGFVGAGLGFLVYAATPFIVGLLKSMAQSFK